MLQGGLERERRRKVKQLSKGRVLSRERDKILGVAAHRKELGKRNR